MAEPETKEKIILAAKKLFAMHGFEGTSTRDIVAEAGVNISLIAYYFKSKENLFFTLFEQFPVAECLPKPEGADALLLEFRKIISSVIKLRFDEPELVTILQQELYRQSPRSERILELLIPTWSRIRDLIHWGTVGHLFQVEDLDMVLSCVMSVAAFPRQHLLYKSHIHEAENAQDVIQEILQFIFRGLGCSEQNLGGF